MGRGLTNAGGALGMFVPTARQTAMVKEYLVNGGDKTAAYVAAYRPGTKGPRLRMEVKRHWEQAGVQVLLRQVDTEERKALHKALVKHGASKENLINELCVIAFSDPASLAAWPGGKLADKTQALFNLAKMQGYIIDRKDIRFVGRIEDLSDAELLALEEQARADLDPQMQGKGTRH